jgi:hypothetical protein
MTRMMEFNESLEIVRIAIPNDKVLSLERLFQRSFSFRRQEPVWAFANFTIV